MFMGNCCKVEGKWDYHSIVLVEKLGKPKSMPASNWWMEVNSIMEYCLTTVKMNELELYVPKR